MPLFTVKWPFLARSQAIVLFPVSLILANEIERVRNYVDDRLIPALSPLGEQFGVSTPTVGWIATAIVVIVPYVAASLVADRLLTVRKGYAFLSIVAVAIWAFVAMHWSDEIAAFIPDAMMDELTWRPFKQEAGLGAGGLALLLHLRPLWLGLRDNGEVAMRLMDSGYHPHSPDNAAEAEALRLRDVYYRQTADFRGWQRQEELHGVGGGPREASAVTIISAATWIGMMFAAAFAYHHWDNLAPTNRRPPPDPRVLPQVATQGPPPAPPVTAPHALPIMPPNVAQADGHAIPTLAFPTVQRPSEPPLDSGDTYGGSNEAIAERGPDGSFAFNALVNGTHLPMLFDTGASVVALRAEDAARIGINLSRLNYSAKVKTANGVAEVAPILIETLTIGNITQRKVPGYVARQGMLQENLLGQTFLTRLAGYNVERNRLVLTGR